jgi:hypothetical protein
MSTLHLYFIDFFIFILKQSRHKATCIPGQEKKPNPDDKAQGQPKQVGYFKDFH